VIQALGLMLVGSFGAATDADAVRAIVEGRGEWSTRSQPEARAALIELGPTFVGAACEVLLTEPDPSSAEAEEEPGLALTRWDPEALLLEALAAFPAADVVSAVEGTVQPGAPLITRLTAARLLGAFGDASTASSLLALFSGDAPTELARPSVQGRIESALVALVERDPEAWQRLDRLGPRPSLELERVRLGVLIRDGGERALTVLAEVLGDGRTGLDAFVLGALARLDVRTRAAGRDWIVGLAGPRARSEDADVRRAALFLIGQHAAVEHVDELLESLEHADERVRATARRALVELFDVERPDDPDVWRALWRRERAWRGERFDAAVGALDGTDEARVRSALEELIAHPAFRRDRASAVAALARTAPAERARLALACLTTQGNELALEHLIGIAERDDEIGRSARIALADRTGRSFETAAEWRAWWDSDEPVSPARDR